MSSSVVCSEDTQKRKACAELDVVQYHHLLPCDLPLEQEKSLQKTATLAGTYVHNIFYFLPSTLVPIGEREI